MMRSDFFSTNRFGKFLFEDRASLAVLRMWKKISVHLNKLGRANPRREYRRVMPLLARNSMSDSMDKGLIADYRCFLF